MTEPEPDTFQNLIERVRAGDEGAATELVRRYEPMVRRAAWGESIVASEVEGRELAVSEKRQNEANLPVVLIIGIL